MPLSMKCHSLGSAMFHTVAFHARTMWLFTVSEHKSTLYPLTISGVIGALSGPAMTTNQSPTLTSIAARVPYTLFWTWSVLLIFSISNQWAKKAILEDSINKPWRPIASQRLTPAQAQGLLLWLLPTVYALSLYLCTQNEAGVGMLLTWMYNDLKGADDYVARNLLCSFGLTLWSVGATKVACGAVEGHVLNAHGHAWVRIICLIIATTLQLQDFRDQAGDFERGRSTAQLVWGDASVRWITAFVMGFWSLAAPWWWNVDMKFYIPTVLVWSFIAGRLLVRRDPQEDRKTWRLWGLWMVSIFALPLCRNSTTLLA